MGQKQVKPAPPPSNRPPLPSPLPSIGSFTPAPTSVCPPCPPKCIFNGQPVYYDIYDENCNQLGFIPSSTIGCENQYIKTQRKITDPSVCRPCSYSEWTDWSDCDCNTKLQTRSRTFDSGVKAKCSINPNKNNLYIQKDCSADCNCTVSDWKINLPSNTPNCSYTKCTKNRSIITPGKNCPSLTDTRNNMYCYSPCSITDLSSSTNQSDQLIQAQTMLQLLLWNHGYGSSGKTNTSLSGSTLYDNFDQGMNSGGFTSCLDPNNIDSCTFTPTFMNYASDIKKIHVLSNYLLSNNITLITFANGNTLDLNDLLKYVNDMIDSTLIA